ncbi:MAG: T9SS type A sorting domain-containing protein, partial [Saprospiraceae bacterium]|nr:T9SS type A sorting domain-containing protein [Saprospiraceae bacterium]
IEKNETKEVLTVMPNPSQGWLDVQFQPGAGTQFVIFNSIGKPVKQMPAPTGVSSVTVDLSGEPTGIYHVVLLNQANKVVAQNRISISR